MFLFPPGKPFQTFIPIVRNIRSKRQSCVQLQEWKDTLINDFEASVFPQHPVIGEIKRELYHQGAIYASMSGSGSSVFGLFAPGSTLPEIDWGTDAFCFKGTLNK